MQVNEAWYQLAPTGGNSWISYVLLQIHTFLGLCFCTGLNISTWKQPVRDAFQSCERLPTARKNQIWSISQWIKCDFDGEFVRSRSGLWKSLWHFTGAVWRSRRWGLQVDWWWNMQLSPPCMWCVCAQPSREQGGEALRMLLTCPAAWKAFSHSLSNNVSSALPLAIFCLASKRGDRLVNIANEYSQIPVKTRAADACCWYL